VESAARKIDATRMKHLRRYTLSPIKAESDRLKSMLGSRYGDDQKTMMKINKIIAKVSATLSGKTSKVKSAK
jgi:hypothetical protein